MADLTRLREKLAALDSAQAAQDQAEIYKAASTVIAAAREVAAQAAAPSADRAAIKMLVAAGFVTEEKANEALCIAHGFASGPLAQAAATAAAAFPVEMPHPKDDGIIGDMHRAYADGWNACRKAAMSAGLPLPVIDPPAASASAEVDDAAVSRALSEFSRVHRSRHAAMRAALIAAKPGEVRHD